VEMAVLCWWGAVDRLCGLDSSWVEMAQAHCLGGGGCVGGSWLG
jgi:hypothetical protein